MRDLLPPPTPGRRRKVARGWGEPFAGGPGNPSGGAPRGPLLIYGLCVRRSELSAAEDAPAAAARCCCPGELLSFIGVAAAGPLVEGLPSEWPAPRSRARVGERESRRFG